MIQFSPLKVISMEKPRIHTNILLWIGFQFHAPFISLVTGVAIRWPGRIRTPSWCESKFLIKLIGNVQLLLQATLQDSISSLLCFWGFKRRDQVYQQPGPRCRKTASRCRKRAEKYHEYVYQIEKETTCKRARHAGPWQGKGHRKKIAGDWQKLQNH